MGRRWGLLKSKAHVGRWVGLMNRFISPRRCLKRGGSRVDGGRSPGRLVNRLAAANPLTRTAFEHHRARRLPDGWRDALAAHKSRVAARSSKTATRKASGDALEALTALVPHLIGGSADLTGSVNTLTPNIAPIAPGQFSGSYIHYGVREHGMAAIMNGLSLHGGYIPYAGTFLVFAGYMLGALRLSALMGTQVVYVFTHDSIGLGEDGPTHQPVETLAMLRSIPNLVVLRPCDGVEAAEAWEIALDRTQGPAAIVLSRQELPTLRREAGRENRSVLGGYVLAEAICSPRLVTLIATGSEVSLASDARLLLEAEGAGTALVSMPSFELFEKQTEEYRERFLGPRNGVRVGVEAAISFGWDRYLGSEGGFVGMTGFGASGPAEALYQHFGITAEAIAATKRALVLQAKAR